MYLTKKTYVGGKDNKLKITGIKSQIDISRVKLVVEDIAYWRKANAIHKWFVNNVQDSEDDCRPYEVSAEKLRELLELCRQVQTQPKKAPELLPTQGGFIFGSTEYDNDYFYNINYTIEVLKSELKKDSDPLQIYNYESSW